MHKPIAPVHARNTKILGWSDQGGRPDGVQVMVEKGFAYVGHIFSKGFSVVDVREPSRPVTVAYVPAPENTWNLHLQTHEELLLVVHAKDMFAQPELEDERNYYKGKANFHAHGHNESKTWSAGLAVYDIKDGANPRQIGFMPVVGGGLHRVWYTGGRWAYASALLDGFSDYILITIDMQNPTRPIEVGRFWLPGMNLAAGEVPDWRSEFGRFGLHHPIVKDDVAYCSWRDACLVIVDVNDKANPKLLSHRLWSPPFGGGTHNALPLPERELLVVLDEAVLDAGADGEKPIWLFDIRDKSNPISIATFPEPSDNDYIKVGGHYGPHNLYENRPGHFVSENIIFATYQNAGLRIYDISDKFNPVEVGALVPSAPKRLIDPRPGRANVLHSADVFVDADGLIYFTDFNAGMYIAEFKG